MVKQTKVIKFMLFVLILIPMVLFLTAIIQTFVLKDAKNKLDNANSNLNQLEQEYNDLNQKHNYVYNKDGTISEEYLEEYYKHNGNGYGNEGDIQVEFK